MRPEYSVLIRTFNSEATLPQTLAALQRQNFPPNHYVIVDSGSTDQTLAQVPPGATVHKYVGAEFNYSEALNQGLKLVVTEFVLIVSSHTTLNHPEAMAYALTLLRSNPDIGAAYFLSEREPVLRHALVDKEKFDGFNGLWNTCALLRTSLLAERSFRPEVFTAEDQEWAGWYLVKKGGRIAQIIGGGMNNFNARGGSLQKQLNEYVAVAYFTNRRLLGWRNVLRLIWQGVKPGSASRENPRGFYLNLAIRLTACRFAPPRYRSKYF